MKKTDSLRCKLESILASYTSQERLKYDPLQFVHKYLDPKDQEVVGFLAAQYAYGNVSQIITAIKKILDLLGKNPAGFVLNFNIKKDSKLFDKIVHRWTKGEDLSLLLYVLQQAIIKYGSIQNLFLLGYDSSHPTIKKALSAFVKVLFVDKVINKGGNKINNKIIANKGFSFFMPDPESGSPCKRWNLYLRWMVRYEKGLDLGLWDKISPSKLIIPLDTHIARIGKEIGLTTLKTPSWRMAEEITNSLAKFDQNDPLKYDFALCHYGISKDFSKNKDIKV